MENTEQRKEQIVGLPVKLPNFYRPSTFLNPKKTDSNDQGKFPPPENGKYYSVEELRKCKAPTIFERCEYPKEGGLLVYLRWYKYPIKGFPVEEMVRALGYIKGTIPILMDLIFPLIKNPLCWFTLRKAVNKMALRLIENCHKNMGLMTTLFPESPKLYNRMTREIDRAITKVYKFPELGSTEESMLYTIYGWYEKICKLRNLICFGLEFDNAYRLRAQDWLNEMDKSAFLKNPRKEIIRIMSLAAERENRSHIRERWLRIKTLINLYLMVDRKLVKKLKEIVSELNFDEFKWDESDIYYTDSRVDYNFRGIKR